MVDPPYIINTYDTPIGAHSASSGQKTSKLITTICAQNDALEVGRPTEASNPAAGIKQEVLKHL